MQDFGAGTVHFVQEEHHGLVVHGEPVGRHELGLAGLLVLVGQADEVARVTHLPQEQGDDGYALVLEVAGDDFALADAVFAHEQDVLCRWRGLENGLEVAGVDGDSHYLVYSLEFTV